MPNELTSDLPWPYPGESFPAALGAVVQRTVLRGELPALVVVHDHEGDWLVGDGVHDPNEDDACVLAHMGHIAERDSTVAALADLPPGWQARRESAMAAWVRSPHQYDD